MIYWNFSYLYRFNWLLFVVKIDLIDYLLSSRLISYGIFLLIIFSLSQLLYVCIYKHNNQVDILNFKFYWAHSNLAFITWCEALWQIWRRFEVGGRAATAQSLFNPILALLSPKQRRSSVELATLLVEIKENFFFSMSSFATSFGSASDTPEHSCLYIRDIN